jgi:hypothetical protein
MPDHAMKDILFDPQTEYPEQHQIDRLLAAPEPDWRPTGLDRNAYLDLIEPVVRLAAGWVDAQGAVIDPVLKKEWHQTTPRFVAPAAILMHFGRSPELLDLVIRAMSYCCRRLPEPEAREASPDFWMRELATAYLYLKPLVPGELAETWRKNLARVEPEKIYQYVDPTHRNLETFHNWAVFSSGGESMREHLGIGASGDFLWGDRFFDVYMAGQLHRLTALGMYRDPGDPITYDITTRLQIANALEFGYRGKWHDLLDEFLRRGGLTTLLFMPAAGVVPYGGRSGAQQFQEAIVAVLAELEAKRWSRCGHAELAGAFKRQAHLAAGALREWLLAAPPRHVKNRFAIDSLHGCDDYGNYSVYSLCAASVLGLAALFADDAVAERPTLAERGGVLLEIAPAFHKIIAGIGGHYAEIDLCADPAQEATGLGRVLLRNVPFGMLPAMSFSDHPKYKIAFGRAPEQPVAIGPCWAGGSAAATPEAALGVGDAVITADEVGWTTTGRYGDRIVIQRYTLNGDGLRIVCRVTTPTSAPVAFNFECPVLCDDGASRPHWEIDGATAACEHVRLIASGAWRDGDRIANRHGVYRNLHFRADDGVAELRITAK